MTKIDLPAILRRCDYYLVREILPDAAAVVAEAIGGPVNYETLTGGGIAVRSDATKPYVAAVDGLEVIMHQRVNANVCAGWDHVNVPRGFAESLRFMKV